MNIVVMDRQ